MTKSARFAPALLLLLACACGQRTSDIELIAVTGSVTLMDGTPVPNAMVRFIPMGTTKGIESSGQTDKDGKFRLKTIRGGDGAAAGEHKVTISKFVRPDGSDYIPGEADDPATLDAKELLPANYSDPDKSTLRKVVKDDGKPHEFKLNLKKTWK